MTGPETRDCYSSVIRVSGCHGVGKTTLLADLAATLHATILDRLPLPQSTSLYQQMRHNLARHICESRRERRVTVPHSDAIALQDRCIYDWLAYLRAYERLGSLDVANVARLLVHYRRSVGRILLPQYVIFVDAPAEWIFDNLRARALSDAHKPLSLYGNDLTAAVVVELKHAVFTDASSRGSRVLHITSLDRAERVSLATDWLRTILPLKS